MDERGNSGKLLTILFFAAAFAAVFAAGGAWAAVPDAAPVDSFISAGRSAADGVAAMAYDAAVNLFWTLALIQLAWSMIQLALRGGWTMAHITSLLVKEMMFIGFFYWLLTQGNPSLGDGATLTGMFARGLRFLGGTAAGGAPNPINPASFLFTCLESLHKLTNAAFQLGVYNAVWAVVPYALTLVSFCFAAAFAVVYLLEYYVVLPAGIILLGLGGTEWTKRFATNYVRVLISVGFKLLCLQIVLTAAQIHVAAAGAAFDNVSDLAADGFFQNAFKFAGFSAVIFLSVKTIPQTAANMVRGAFFGRANWLEPASFPPFAAATAGYAPSGQPSGGGEGTRGVTGTVSTTSTSGFAGIQPGAAEHQNPVASSLSSGAAAAGQVYSSFQGAGFGNYAHDIVFDNDRPGSAAIPDARGGVIPDARGTATPDARGTTIPDARGTTMPDARDSVIPDARGATTQDARGSVMPDARGATIPDAQGGVIPDARGTTIPDARGSAMPDARSSVTPDARGSAMPDARGSAMPDARGSVTPDARGSVTPDARSSAMPDARGSVTPDARGSVMPDARGSVTPDARSSVTPDARGSVMPDARGSATPDARPAPTSADMRQAMHDSMKNT
jgi:type IV secretion system protein TrbL